eukprot:s1469_g6.t4
MFAQSRRRQNKSSDVCQALTSTMPSLQTPPVLRWGSDIPLFPLAPEIPGSEEIALETADCGYSVFRQDIKRFEIVARQCSQQWPPAATKSTSCAVAMVRTRKHDRQCPPLRKFASLCRCPSSQNK